MRTILSIFFFIFVLSSCKKEAATQVVETPEAMYFPGDTTSVWESKSMASLNWNLDSVQALKDFLAQKNTKSFLILVNGRIVMEEYFNGHTAKDTWQWNSAGKTLVAASTGIAQEEGLLSINNKVSDYLNSGWTSMPLDKENLITVRHLLTMTSGNDDTKQLMIKSNITYVADAGTRWAYSNIFQKLTDVVANASKQPFESYFNEKLKNKIGMDGFWNVGPIFTIYHSSTRSMARFGLLALNKGKWKDTQVLNESYLNACTNTSQQINPAYGYLWWLNGKSNFMVPSEQNVYLGPLIPNAPADMFAAMGASDQRIYVIPSKNMVVVRMGEASDINNPNFAVSGFDDVLWKKISAVVR